MKRNRRVIWSEGMFLRPQHFQQSVRHSEFVMHHRALAAEPYFWGFRELVLDSTALSLGQLGLIEASGLFADGTPFSLPANSPLPLPLHFDEGAVDQIIYLCLPLPQRGTTNVVFEETDGSTARYLVEQALVADENSIAGEPAEIQVALPRIRLVSEKHLNEGWLHLAVCRVLECRSDKRLVLDPEFVPPITACHASPYVLALLQEAFGLIHQRADALAERLAAPGRGGISEVGEFLLLQLLNRCQPLVAHLIGSDVIHPERLYRLLVQTVSELATFVETSRRPAELPPYRHDNLRASLQPLLLRLRSSLSVVLEQNAIQIPLQERKYGVRLAEIADLELLRTAQFVLAVNAALPPEAVRGKFPAHVKIGPADRIRDLVNLQLPGVGLQLLPIAPRQIPYHAGYCYFEMDTSSDFWKQLQDTGALALHVAGEFPELALECWAIRR